MYAVLKVEVVQLGPQTSEDDALRFGDVKQGNGERWYLGDAQRSNSSDDEGSSNTYSHISRLPQQPCQRIRPAPQYPSVLALVHLVIPDHHQA
jgi:hypothetical protein